MLPTGSENTEEANKIFVFIAKAGDLNLLGPFDRGLSVITMLVTATTSVTAIVIGVAKIYEAGL